MTSEVLPLQKGGGGWRKSLAMLKGDTTSFGVFLTRLLGSLAILEWEGRGERKMFYPVP